MLDPARVQKLRVDAAEFEKRLQNAIDGARELGCKVVGTRNHKWASSVCDRREEDALKILPALRAHWK